MRQRSLLIGCLLALVALGIVAFQSRGRAEGVEVSDVPEAATLALAIAPDSILIKLKPSASLLDLSPSTVSVADILEESGVEAIDVTSLFPTAAFESDVPGMNGMSDPAAEELVLWKEITLQTPMGYEGLPVAQGDAPYEEIQELLEELRKNPNVLYAEPNYVVHVLTQPNDPFFTSVGGWGQSYDDLWGMKKIGMPVAWDLSTGSAQIIIADIDTGVDRNHSDLAANMWTNSGEIAGNNIDDDNNGYVDDVHGWDFANNDNDPMDDHGHGTHTVGTIAGVGNNGTGIVGVNWTSKVMALKFLDANGSGNLDGAVKALKYSADMGARISSNSWGCGCHSFAIDDAVKYAHDRGQVVVAAAGNDHKNALDFSPAGTDRAVTVGATNVNDNLACFSNNGEKIDVVAPGGDSTRCGGISDYILSARAATNSMCPGASTVGGSYCIARGTSMAAPHVAGLAALLLAKNPALTNEQVRQILRASANDLGAVGKDMTFGFGRINAAQTLALAMTAPLTPLLTSPSSRTTLSATNNTVRGSIGGTGLAQYTVEFGLGRSPVTWQTLSTDVQVPASGVLGTINVSTLNDGVYTVRLTAEASSGTKNQFQVYDLLVDNFDAYISYPAGLVPKTPSVSVSGTAVTKNGLTFDRYTLEWGVGTSPTSWSTTGVTIVNGGTQSVPGGRLGTWDTSGFNDGAEYALRLRVYSSAGTFQETIETVTIDKDILPGWPKTIEDTGSEKFVPVIADLDGNGTKEIIFGFADGKIYAYNKDGSTVPGFPFSLAVEEGETANWQVNVDDIDADGRREIAFSTFNRVYLLRHDGTMYPGWPKTNLQLESQAHDPTPSIIDLNGDGKKELIVVELKSWFERTDMTVHAYQPDGAELSGFPRIVVMPSINASFPDRIWPSYHGTPNVSDLDGDAKPEIAVSFSNYIYLFDYQGNVVPGWPFILPKKNGKFMLMESALASGDVDGDGQREILGLTRRQQCGGCETQLYAIRKDATVVPGWAIDVQASLALWETSSRMNTPALGDIDGDNKDEAIVGLNVLITYNDGEPPIVTGIGSNTQPSVVNAGTELSLTFGSYNGFGVTNSLGADASWPSQWNRIFNGGTFMLPGVQADMDGDGQNEVAGYQGTYVFDSSSSVYLWQVPRVSTSVLSEWPMFSHDPAHSGNMKGPRPDIYAPAIVITGPANGAVIRR